MVYRADDMQQDIDDACHAIEDSRAAMTEKLAILEARVRGTVEGVQSSLEEIVENVKDRVDTTVETLKRTFDVQYQVDQHPWLMLGGATLVGYLLGLALLPRLKNLKKQRLYPPLEECLPLGQRRGQASRA